MESVGTSATAFVVDEPYATALPRIRRALRTGRLSIAAEIDSAERVKRSLEIYVPPCRVLLLDTPRVSLEATAIDRGSAVFIPLHLVVSGAASRTLLHLLSLEHIRRSELPIGIRAPVQDLHREIMQALGKIARRAPDLEEMADRGETGASGEKAVALRRGRWFGWGR